MDFRTRLKEEIEYVGIQYKELATKADVKQRALFTYVATNPSMPPADVAVRIARVLGVTVEYLVYGEQNELPNEQTKKASVVQKLSQKQRQLLQHFDRLSATEQKAMLKLAETLASQHDENAD